MNAKERLIDALQSELDNADFETELSCDNSYQLFIAKITEICNFNTDNSLDIHDIVEIINIIDDLELSLKETYLEAVKYLIGA